MASTLKVALFFPIFAFFFLSPITSSKLHPLDSLTPSELLLIRAIVNQSYPISNNQLTFNYVGLEEPEKPVVKSWLSKPSTKSPPRQALVVIRLNQQTHELILDLSKRSIISDKVYNGSLLAVQEEDPAADLALKYKPFLASLRKRGLNISEVICVTSRIRWYGEEKTKREVKIICYYLNGTVNMYLRPINGISIVVDLDEMKISEYIDRAVAPLPKAEGTEYRASKLTPPFGPRFNGAPPPHTTRPNRVQD
ncbi:hypothetical protein CRYUN_Cryun18bG0039800 [Craigia yunnanensis]